MRRDQLENAIRTACQIFVAVAVSQTLGEGMHRNGPVR